MTEQQNNPAASTPPSQADHESLLAQQVVAAADDPIGLPARGVLSVAASQAVQQANLDSDGVAASLAPLAELGRQIAAGEVDPVTHVQGCLQAIDARPELNAFVYVDAQGALSKARSLAARVAAGQEVGPLAGVVLAVKDCIVVKGLPYQAGSAALPAQTAQRSAAVVERLEQAGAIVIGMANMHELSYGGLSNNPHFGSVGHPQDPSRIPGGSSGGSAVAVAAGMADFALGTDAAGSVRMPAALCGLVGFKASYDLVPRDGVIPLTWSLDHIGPLTKTVADAALVTALMVGLPAASQMVQAVNREPLQKEVGVFYPENYFHEWLEPGVRDVFDRAMQTLQAAGLRVTKGKIAELDMAPTLQYFTMAAEATQVHQDLGLLNPARLGDDVRTRLEAGRSIRAVDYLKAQRLRTALKRALSAPLLGGARVMVTPTVLTGACPADAVLQRGDHEIPVRTVLTRLTYPFNLTGMPAISIPCGYDDAGFPVGLHIAGKSGDDVLVLAIAAQFEQLLAGALA